MHSYSSIPVHEGELQPYERVEQEQATNTIRREIEQSVQVDEPETVAKVSRSAKPGQRREIRRREIEQSVQVDEPETVAKVSRSANTGQRRDTVPFPDMSRESLSIDQLKEQFGLFEVTKWSKDEAKVKKMISWIAATPNWQQSRTLRHWYSRCHNTLEKARLKRQEQQIDKLSKEGPPRKSRSMGKSDVQRITSRFATIYTAWKRSLGQLFAPRTRTSKFQ